MINHQIIQRFHSSRYELVTSAACEQQLHNAEFSPVPFKYTLLIPKEIALEESLRISPLVNLILAKLEFSSKFTYLCSHVLYHCVIC